MLEEELRVSLFLQEVQKKITLTDAGKTPL